MGAGWLALVSGPWTGGTAWAQPETVDRLQTLVASAEKLVLEVRSDEAELARQFDQHRLLERMITARKADGDRSSPELKADLRASLELETTIRATLSRRDRRREAARAQLRNGMTVVDAAIREQLPRLRSGPLADRRQAAAEINRLRALRTTLVHLETQIEPRPEGSFLNWKDLALEPSPSDSPEDLRDKADFVEDARDKLRAKRARLARLWRRSRQEKAVARAAREFAADVSLFDEESRSPRIQRPVVPTGGSNPVAEGGGSSGQDGAPSPQAPSQGDSDGFAPAQGPESPTPPSGDFISDPGTGDPSADAPATPNPPAGGGSGGGNGGANPNGLGVIPQELTPNYLLNLNVDRLPPEGVDVETMRRLIEELKQLDEALAARALSMRQAAEDLEQEP